ncbi:MAG: hypothetical protein KIT58_11220, partial [Planctomycetota bacterium]|nr:hypothetical protein [Planctomycetota bacterium]
SFGLREVHALAVKGVTVCDALELLSEEPVSIALAVLGTPAGNRLSEAFRRCPQARRRAIGARGLQRTRDGLIFAVFDGGEALRRVREFLPEDSPVAEAHPPDDTPPATAPFLEALRGGIRHLEQRSATEFVTEGAERARWLLQLLLDTADHDAPLSERLARWGHRCSAPLAGIVTAAEAAGALPGDLASDLVALAEARVQAVQGVQPGPGVTSCSSLDRLLELVNERTLAVSPAALSPMLEELDGCWAVLELLGHHVGYLDLESGAELRAPLPALQTIEDARRSSTAAASRVAASVIARSLRGAQVEVRDQVLWLAHITGDRGLVARLEALGPNDAIQLRVDGVVGTWTRMRDGSDGRPTLGLKPVGAAATAWREAYRRREARPLVEISPAPSTNNLASARDADVVLPSDAGSSPAGVDATP